MGEFFRGWRRKAGCVSLVLSCVFMIGWVRSHVKDDIFVVNLGKTWCLTFQSNQCGLGIFAAAYGTDSSTISVTWNSQPIRPLASKDPMTNNNVDVPIRIDFHGFHFGCDGLNLLRPRYYAICFLSYFYLIAPLTLLSAYLLLVTPRIAKPRDVVENVNLG